MNIGDCYKGHDDKGEERDYTEENGDVSDDCKAGEIEEAEEYSGERNCEVSR